MGTCEDRSIESTVVDFFFHRCRLGMRFGFTAGFGSLRVLLVHSSFKQ